MNYNNHHIEKRSFEAFVNAIGTEIEQAQVRLISAANAQMLFHYWKMGNYILYHQAQQGWGGKVIKKLAQAIRFNYPEKKGYSERNLTYMCQFARLYPLNVLRDFIKLDARLSTPSIQTVVQEVLKLNNGQFTQELPAQIQPADNQSLEITQEPPAQFLNVAKTVETIYQNRGGRKLIFGITCCKDKLGKPYGHTQQFAPVGHKILVYEAVGGNGMEQQCPQNAD